MPIKVSSRLAFCYIYTERKMKHLAHFNLWPLAAAALIEVAAGCDRDSVKVYQADASDTATTPPPAATPGAMPATMPDGLAVPDNSGQPQLKYTLPDGWKEKALTQMRVASFEVSENGKSADISVIPLGAMSGGDAANVNRWRGQVGQPPLDETAVAQLAEKITVGGQPADLYDIAGTSPGSGDPERIIGTILHSDTATWYFKMSGDADLAAKQKANFIAFLKSVEFGQPAEPAAMDLSQLPPSHPAIDAMSLGTQNTLVTNPNTVVIDGTKPTWTVPADWKEGQLAQFLVAKFIIGSGDATAAVNVSSLAGDGGGLAANVNRWRAQLGLAPFAETDLANLPTIEASSGKASLVEIAGTDARTGKPARLTGLVLPLGGQTWFYKLMGDADVVGAQKDAFIKFVQSAKYPSAQ
jgi:hypothetical protein